MNTTEWLRRQVETLEREIRRSSLFEDDLPATTSQLHDLRRKVVLHTYLKQQLLRRAPVLDPEEYDTRELTLVRKA